jgi:hypothetical protein
MADFLKSKQVIGKVIGFYISTLHIPTLKYPLFPGGQNDAKIILKFKL